jgi:plasmid maintenance system antidote protein VapI
MALETMVIPRQCVAEVSRCALAAILAAVPRTLALCDVVLPPLGICKTRLARRLGFRAISFPKFSPRGGSVTNATALKLESVVGGSAQSWTEMQAAYDDWPLGRGRDDGGRIQDRGRKRPIALYSRETESHAQIAKVPTEDEARRVGHIAKLPRLIKAKP